MVRAVLNTHKINLIPTTANKETSLKYKIKYKFFRKSIRV